MTPTAVGMQWSPCSAGASSTPDAPRLTMAPHESALCVALHGDLSGVSVARWPVVFVQTEHRLAEAQLCDRIDTALRRLSPASATSIVSGSSAAHPNRRAPRATHKPTRLANQPSSKVAPQGSSPAITRGRKSDRRGGDGRHRTWVCRSPLFACWVSPVHV